MKIKRKPREFTLEIRLGLILIILLLAILDIAAHYTLYRVGETVESQIREELTESAVIAANAMSRVDKISLPPGLEKNISEKYDLLSLDILPLNYDRVLAIRDNDNLDDGILAVDSTLVAADLSALLMDHPVYRHANGSDWYQLIFPTEYLGSSYMVIVSKPSSILGPIENAMRILIFFGILTAVLIIFISIRLIHKVIDPFNRLKAEAEKSGHYAKDSDDDIEQLIKSYEEIINELKSKEERLVELNRIISRKASTLEEMSAGLAHQLRNSMAAIIGFAKIIEKRSNNEIALKNIKYMNDEARQAEALIVRFLDYARPLKAVWEEIDLDRMVSEMQGFIAEKYPNIILRRTNSNEADSVLDGDSLLLKQALSNIVDNSCKAYDGADGEIIISHEISNYNHIIRITDFGPGIPEAMKENVFTPFYSGNPSGSGLGLALVQKIINLHDGQIELCDNPEGGTIFSISIPFRNREKADIQGRNGEMVSV